jgi:hypothetical protein
MAIEQAPCHEGRVILIEVFACSERLLERSVCNLLCDEEDGRLVGGDFEHLHHEFRLDILELLEVLWKLDMRELEQFDGDGYVGIVLESMPNRVVIGGEEWLIFAVVVLLENGEI